MYACMHLIDWLIDGWIDGLMDWWIDGLMDWWIDGLMDWWIDGLMDWLIDWWIDWLMDGLIDWVIDWSMDWSINFWLNHCLVLCLMDWTKREKKKASNDWLLGLCVSGSQWHGSNSWKYQFDFSYSLEMLWIIWSTLYLKTKCLFSFKSSPNHEMERVNGPLTSANLVVPAPLNHMDHPSTLCISPFLPCLTTKPVWLLLDPQNKTTKHAQLSKQHRFFRQIRKTSMTRSNQRGTPIPVLLTGKSFSRIHSILAVQRASLDQLKTKRYEDLQCPNKQEKRVDTTFAITTTITPDSTTQDSGWETPSKRKYTSGASKFCSLKFLQATI